MKTKHLFIIMCSFFSLTSNAQKYRFGIELKLYKNQASAPWEDTSQVNKKRPDGVCYGLGLLTELGSFTVKTGVWYRDYGRSVNNTTIPYWTIPLTINLNWKWTRNLSAVFSGGLEFGGVIEKKYYSINPINKSDAKYDLFKHKNNAITYNYGLGLKRKFFSNIELSFLLNFNNQLDKWDGRYGPNLNSLSYDVGLTYKFKKINN